MKPGILGTIPNVGKGDHIGTTSNTGSLYSRNDRFGTLKLITEFSVFKTFSFKAGNCSFLKLL